jgi:glycosyltransferase involved in cell wall biosynthesis
METAVTLVSRFKPGIGIGTYTQSLYAALRRRRQTMATLFQVAIPSRRSSEVLAPLWVWWRLGGHRATVYHADYTDSALGLLLRRRAPLVVTIHDDIPFRYPADRHPLWLLSYKVGFALLKRRCSAIITVSEYSRRDLLRHGLDPAKVFVVYNGVDARRFFPLPRVERPQIVIGYLASLARRKRVDRLLQAYGLLRRRTDKVRLVIGGSGPLLGELKTLAAELDLKDVEFRGFVPDDGLNEFYNGLDIFAFPSDYEGFGLPLLEAMACKVPVVATNLSSHPEIVGDAGVLVEPDPQSLADGLMRLVEDPALRQDLAARGHARSGQFTWERCAEETMAVYGKVRDLRKKDRTSRLTGR